VPGLGYRHRLQCKEPIPAKPGTTLAKRLKEMGPDISAFAEELDPFDFVGEVFKDRNQTSTSPQLDIIIRIPAHITGVCFIR
jgi:hypothetical protein